MAADAVEFVKKTLEETNDSIIVEGWRHPLTESHEQDGELYFNKYGFVTMVMTYFVFENNPQVTETLNKTLLAHNPLINLTQCHRELNSRLESSWMMIATKLADGFDKLAKVAN